MLSPVERRFLKLSGRQESYPSEKIPTLEVVNIYELGKIVALRFLEWCHENPKGVVALPTGRTPEFFIKTLEAYKTGWDTPEVRMEVTGFGFTRSEWPDTTGLTFVMLDEFFPMLPTHRNSFCLYIRTFYATLLGIPEERILTFDLVKSGILTDTEITELSAFDIDVSLLERQAVNEQEDKIKSVLTRVDAYCQSYEEKIQSLGGIGFFLGGIGPDGHVAFNQEGCDHECRTRLVNFNYPSAAAAAGDLGGIEIARGKAAMTIGLQTIRNNPDATIIVMAAGEGKASVVRDAIEEGVDRKRPASAFQGHSGARFYITHGAAKKLPARQAEDIQKVPLSCIEWALNHLSGLITDRPHLVEPTMEYLQMENLLYETSFETKVPVHELNVEHLDQTPQGRASPAWLHSELNFKLLRSCASRRLREKVEGGLRSVSMKHQSILHTAPHHDDIMLSYHAAMHEMMGRRCVDEDGHPVQPKHRPRWGRGDMSDMDLGEATNDNVNHFAYLTSGFHSVNDSFLQKQVDAVRGPDGLYKFLSDAVLAGEITRDYDDLMGEFRSAFFAQNFKAQDRVEHIIFLRKMAEVFNVRVTLAYQSLIRELGKAVENLRVEYLDKHSPGDGIPKDIQLLKGCMRESEVDRVWALSNMPMNRVHHMRSKFYTDDFFTPMPSLEDDAMPMANLIKARQPHMISVAFDPEGTGPDTHYKVLQVVAAGLRISMDRGDLKGHPDPIVWGYRNVWFVFTPADATLLIPASADDLELMHDTFMSCFTTQKAASFPSPHYDGPFSAWARHLQILQKKELTVLMGEKYFKEHRDPRVRQASGFVYLKAMRAERFLKEVEELKTRFETIKPNIHSTDSLDCLDRGQD